MSLLPGYEQQIIAGAGLNVGPGKPKVVLHTTETGSGSLQFLIDHWRGNWGSGLPHFIVEGTRVVQLLPLNVGAYTLENAPGGADTNRSGPAVQAEIVSYADKDWDDATYTSVGRLLADVKRAGHNFDLGIHPRWYGANEGIILAAYNSPVRMMADQYNAFNGWCAHQHVPENAHWDCGKKDTDRIERIARAWYDNSAPGPEPEEDDMPYTPEQLTEIIGPVVRAELEKNNANVNQTEPYSNLQLHGDMLGLLTAIGKISPVIDPVMLTAMIDAIRALPTAIVDEIKARL